MIRICLVAAQVLSLVHGKEQAACSGELLRIKELESKLVDLESELETAKTTPGRISLTALGAQCISFSNDVVRHVLSSTQLDSHGAKVFDTVSTRAVAVQAGAAAFTSNVVGHVSAINYTKHLHSVKSSQAFQTLLEKSQIVHPYVEQAKPMLEKAKTACRPVLEKAEPAFATAKQYCLPVFDKAIETCSLARSAVEDQVLPTFRSSSLQGMNSAVGAGFTRFNNLMTPAFGHAGRMAPNHADALPEHAVDRVLFMIAFIIFAYYSLYLSLYCLRLTLKFLGKTTLVSFFLFRALIMLPLRIILKTISCVFWMATCFHCCGLCSAKKAVKKDKKNKSDKVPQQLSVADVEGILRQAQKTKSEDKALKTFGNLVKSGQPMAKPKSLEGKLITKEVFLQACKKVGLKSGL